MAQSSRLKNRKTSAVLLAVLAAACYGVSSPISKFLMARLEPAFIAALLYLGAGLGIGAILLLNRLRAKSPAEAPLTAAELPFVIGMVLLDILAPILLMFGLKLTNPGTVSLLNNFEIVATSLLAMLLFKEAVGKRMWLAILVITLSSFLLSLDDLDHFTFSPGAALVLLAAISWGLENNFTRKLSMKNPLQVVCIKGLGSGTGALLVAFLIGVGDRDWLFIFLALLLGFFAYGLSITLYIMAQRELGAARTSAFYAVAPFIGVALSLALFGLPPTFSFLAGLVLMVIGAFIAAYEEHAHEHVHEEMTHEHRHSHDDGHHFHNHEGSVGEHSHPHTHEAMAHNHPHTPDLHHRHAHHQS